MLMNLNLIPLIATGTMNSHFPVIYSCNTDNLSLNSKSTTELGFYCDAYALEGLIISKNVNISNIRNINILHNTSHNPTDINYITCEWQIPFNIVLVSSDIKIIDGDYNIYDEKKKYFHKI